ncbi:MAG: hypothetical protein QF596_07940 [Acidimicrobiales bacterium]|nr:hypothetical protein [Acidimicrobiales bacterium]MDP6298593.1 hypothetical protein [Acidimicrobiales bacterium]HJM29099.1 hypothetical protein [Acidimicrobiales bacterium]HJM97414.1 hypothetical protein [Acidimicrobiales bacterium]
MDEEMAQKALQNDAALDRRHSLAIRFATDLMTQPNAMTEELLEGLREFFTDDQLIELSLDVMKWNYQKVSVALGTDREVREGELSELHFNEKGQWSFNL